MKLYYHPLSGYSQKVLVAAYEKGIEFDLEVVNLMDPQSKAAYKKDVYPIGKVPFLIADDDHRVPESSIIIEYLENNFPASGAQLIPSDPVLARQVRFHDRMTDLYIQNQIGVIFFDALKPEEDRNPQAVTQAKDTLDVVYNYLDEYMASGEWMVGNQFSMAECALAPVLNYARQTYPYEQHKNIEAYWNRLCERPSVKRVLEEAAPHMEAFMKKS